MLELMLTRPEERKRLIGSAKGLQFLVLDELHTYRGRQGADVAMLVRRVREACESPDLQCVGTSATMATEGTLARQRRRGRPGRLDALRRRGRPRARRRRDPGAGDRSGHPRPRPNSPRVCGRASRPSEYGELAADPLARWIEPTFGLVRTKDEDGHG